MMSTHHEKILSKIRKCLALSKSSNEHEAAAALRQAQKLMEAHNISETEAGASASASVEECHAESTAIRRPPEWEAQLANGIAKAFGCKLIFKPCVKPCGIWVHIGVGAASEVACYAFDVMLKKAKKARKQYASTALKFCKKFTRVKRSDIYMAGWVASVLNTAIVDFLSSADKGAIESHMARNYPLLKEMKTTKRSAKGVRSDMAYKDYISGSNDGARETLNRGVSGVAAQMDLIGSNMSAMGAT